MRVGNNASLNPIKENLLGLEGDFYALRYHNPVSG